MWLILSYVAEVSCPSTSSTCTIIPSAICDCASLPILYTEENCSGAVIGSAKLCGFDSAKLKNGKRICCSCPTAALLAATGCWG